MSVNESATKETEQRILVSITDQAWSWVLIANWSSFGNNDDCLLYRGNSRCPFTHSAIHKDCLAHFTLHHQIFTHARRKSLLCLDRLSPSPLRKRSYETLDAINWALQKNRLVPTTINKFIITRLHWLLSAFFGQDFLFRNTWFPLALLNRSSHNTSFSTTVTQYQCSDNYTTLHNIFVVWSFEYLDLTSMPKQMAILRSECERSAWKGN